MTLSTKECSANWKLDKVDKGYYIQFLAGT